MKKTENSSQLNLQTINKLFNSRYFWLLIILIMCIVAYYPVLDNNFTNWDDNEYVTDNVLITEFSLKNIKCFFKENYFGIYHPITMISFALNYHFGKMDPGIYYFTSILLHLINTALVFGFIFLLIKRIEVSIITAILFGITTLHVEPVAWLSARKDMLSTMFFLLSLLCYLKYIFELNRKNSANSFFRFLKSKFYYFSILLFMFSTLSKGTAVSLSITLFAIDYLLGRNFKSLIVWFEKILFMLISFVFGIIAIFASNSVGAFSYLKVYSFFERILFACYGFTQYIAKSVIPYKLSAFYPYPEKTGGSLSFHFWLYPIIIIGIIILVVYSFKRYKLFTFSIVFFTINIILLLQLLPLGGYIMADRYAYTPSIGILLLLALGYEFLINKNFFTNYFKSQTRLIVYRGIIRACMIAYFVILIFSTNQYCKTWNNSLTLWNEVISKYPQVTVAWNNRGLYQKEKGNLYNALADYNQAIRVNPNYVTTYSNRGLVKKDLGDLQGAAADFQKAIQIDPNDERFYYNLGITNNLLKHYSAALENFNKAIRLNPNFTLAFCDRGISQVNLNNIQEALNDFNSAIKLSPNFPDAYYNKGIILYTIGSFSEAIANFNITIKLNPKKANSYLNRGLAKIANGQKEEGCLDFHKASELGQSNARINIQKYCLN